MFRTFTTIAFASILSISTACTTKGAETETPDVAGKADGDWVAMRMGTYDVAFSDYYALTLHEDGTFHLQGGCPQTGSGPHCFAITVMDGNYEFTHGSEYHYLRLYNGLDNSLAFHFRYSVSGAQHDAVDLVDTSDDSESTASLEQADKRQEGENCGGFISTASQCADGLQCVQTQGCCDLPGTCELPAPTN